MSSNLLLQKNANDSKIVVPGWFFTKISSTSEFHTLIFYLSCIYQGFWWSFVAAVTKVEADLVYTGEVIREYHHTVQHCLVVLTGNSFYKVCRHGRQLQHWAGEAEYVLGCSLRPSGGFLLSAAFWWRAGGHTCPGHTLTWRRVCPSVCRAAPGQCCVPAGCVPRQARRQPCPSLSWAAPTHTCQGGWETDAGGQCRCPSSFAESNLTFCLYLWPCPLTGTSSRGWPQKSCLQASLFRYSLSANLAVS